MTWKTILVLKLAGAAKASLIGAAVCVNYEGPRWIAVVLALAAVGLIAAAHGATKIDDAESASVIE